MFVGLNLEDGLKLPNICSSQHKATPERYDGGKYLTLLMPPELARGKKKLALPFLGTSKDIKTISVLAQQVSNTEGI